MSRLLIDKTGSYDLARVAAVTIGNVALRDPTNPAMSVATKMAVLHLDGGQVIHTETQFDEALKLWREVKENESKENAYLDERVAMLSDRIENRDAKSPSKANAPAEDSKANASGHKSAPT
jgi:hypothetical protein